MSGQESALTDEQLAQVALRDEVTQLVLLSCDGFMLQDHVREALRGVPQAAYDRALISAAVGFLIGVGSITRRPENNHPLGVLLEVPKHLQPDVAAIQRNNQQLRDWLSRQPGA